MRTFLMAGASLMALAGSPALAQAKRSNAQILARLNALEAKVDALEAQNADLKAELSATSAKADATAQQATTLATQTTTLATQTTALAAQSAASAPARGASSGGRNIQPVIAGTTVQWTIVPQFNSPDGNFSFKPRGLIDIDVAGFDARRGGYDFSNGTQIRRGRFGFDGTAYNQFAWRVEAEYVGGAVSLLDAYVAYTGKKDFTLTLGQLKVPAGLEANTADAFNEFMERGMANTAFGVVGGERRIGATFAYANPLVTATGGIYGANEGVSRTASNQTGDGFGPNEVWGINGRITLEPINKPGRLIHVGASAYRVFDLAGKDLTVADRPNVRVDNGNLESVAFTSTSKNLQSAHDATFYGLEAAAVYGPFSVQGEYSHMHINRTGDVLPSADFHGFYVYGSYFLTGESRAFKGGTIDRVRPLHPFDPGHGDWGAIELATRWDEIDLTDRSIDPTHRRNGYAFTGALNWYLTGNVKILFNYIRFLGTNSPLALTRTVGSKTVYPDGTKIEGDAFAARLHLDF